MIILLIVIGSFLIILGALIWYFELLEITPGFNEENIKDRKKMARWIGICYMLMGSGFIINSLITKYYQLKEIISLVIFTVVIYIFIFIIYIGYKKYSKE